MVFPRNVIDQTPRDTVFGHVALIAFERVMWFGGARLADERNSCVETPAASKRGGWCKYRRSRERHKSGALKGTHFFHPVF